MAIDVDTGNFLSVLLDYELGTLSEDECAIWIGYSRNGRYGDMRWEGRMRRTHRLAYELAYGEIADGLVVCHKCDTPRCMNPHHLFLGTQAENLEDARNKGRLPKRKPKPAARKLTPKQIALVRRSPLSDKYFANRFNVSTAVIRKARSDVGPA